MSNSLPEGWKNVSFGDIAENISKRVDPSETDLDTYVGLEHLDSESLKIKRYGKPSDVKGTKLLVQPDDIIFGKRRAYQRKAAIADFHGICSAHAMVLRTKEENVRKEFLPFFMQSDMFMERALDISEGSLSPTIKWKTLKKQEFPLPPIKEQRKIAEILWAFEDSLRKYERNIEEIVKYKKILIKHLFTFGPVSIKQIESLRMRKTEIGMVPEDWNIVRLGEKCNLIVPMRDKPKKFGGHIPWIRIEDLEGKYITNSKSNRFVDNETVKQMNLKVFPKGTVICSCSGNMGICAITKKELVTNQTFIGLYPNDDFDEDFLFYKLSSLNNFLQNLSTGTTISYIPRKRFHNLKIALPPLKIQRQIGKLLCEVDKNIDLFEKHKNNLITLKFQLLNDLLSGKKERLNK